MSTARTPFNVRRLAGDTYVLPGLTNSGYIDGLVIDTCDDAAPWALASVERIAITHGHADHFAIASELRDAGGKTFAARDDASLIENPDINIRGMFSWAKPGDVLVTKLFQGTPCPVDGYLEEWDDARATVVPLPGHTLGHCGMLTADGVLFTGDSLYLSDLWERHPLPYCIDPTLVAGSLERIRGIDCVWIVPGHGTPILREEADSHIDHHIGEIEAIEGLLLERLVEPHTTEQAIAMVSGDRGLPEVPSAYWLAVTTVKGFLGALLDQGQIEFYVEDHAGWWVTAPP
jgi:glyoxylase-like metal-dependent hydrolase (beta-lactamase superfamily II)